jgi:PAS domain S-box-containing protein
MIPHDPDSSVELKRHVEAIVANATLALFIMDEKQHCVFANRAAELMTGFSLAELRGRALHDVIHHTRPDGIPYPLEECPIDQAFPQNLREQGEEVFVHRDGHFYPVAFTASPFYENGRAVGTIIEVRDTTQEKRAAAEREHLNRELELGRVRLQQVFTHAPAYIAVTRGADHTLEMVNPAYRRMLTGRDVAGDQIPETLPGLAGQGLLELRDRVFSSGETVIQNETRILAGPDGEGTTEELFINAVVQPLRDGDGAIDGVMTFAIDVSDQVRSRQVVEEQATELEAQTEELQNQARRMEEVSARLEEANRELKARAEEAESAGRAAAAAAERLQVLADAGAVLGSSLDFTSTLQELSKLIVPRLADWCFVEMPAADGSIAPVAVAHSDPAMLELAWDVLRRYPVDPSAAVGTPEVIRTGEPAWIPEIPDELLRSAARDEEHYRLLKTAGFRSHVAVPLAIRDRVLGVLTLVMGDSGRSFTADDLPFVRELARRAALGVENSRLFDAERLAREAAERSEGRAGRLASLATALNEAVTQDDVAIACIDHGASALGADSGSLALYRPADNEFEVVHSSYEASVRERWRRFPFNPARPLSQAVSLGEPVLIESLADGESRFPEMRESFRESGTLAFVAIPISTAGRSLGALSFSFGQEQRFAAEDRTFFAALGQQAAQALERARLLEAERAARDEAESANRAKTEFLSAVSHELRTPLNAIAGYVDLLDLGIHGSLGEVQRRHLNRIKHAQAVLLGLINDILNFARIEAGRIEFREQAVDLQDLLVDLEGLLTPQIQAKQLTYHCDPCGEGVSVRGDAERIQQIMLNLVGNAAKFTEAGGTIQVGVAVHGASAYISVSDDGRGIPEDKLDSIFEPFLQLDRHGTHESQQGVGLGLAISRELARAMDGNLTAKSVVGQGSIFTLVLPLDQPEN